MNLGLVLLITKPFEFRAKLTGHYPTKKPTSIPFQNLKCIIRELNTKDEIVKTNISTHYKKGVRISFYPYI